jgi:hypothetical protein
MCARRGEIVKAGIALAVMMTLCPGFAAAQTPVSNADDQLRRHEELSVFEGTLTGAVNLAAHRVAKEVQSRTPSANLFSGNARAKGFALEGYGVFVYVEIPALDLTVSLMVDQFERDQQRRASGDTPVANNVANRPDGTPAAAPTSSATETLRGVEDTGEKYRAAVKTALADAMLDHSKNLDLKPDEWLSVAARGSESALLPGEILQLTTVVLRVKGSDLADYLAGRVTKEQARGKVEVRQF